MKKEKFSKPSKDDANRMQLSPKRPDYSSKRAAVWVNENNGRKWLRIKIAGMNEKFVAFENKGVRKDGKQ